MWRVNKCERMRLRQLMSRYFGGTFSICVKYYGGTFTNSVQAKGVITVTHQINGQPTKTVSILRLLLNFGAAILLVKVIL